MSYYGSRAHACAKDCRVPLPADADSVSCMEFSKANPMFAAGGWDSKVRLWEMARGASGECHSATPKLEQVFGAPVLDLSWQDTGAYLFAACADNTVQLWDLASNTKRPVATHAAPVKHCFWASEANMLVTGSWDKTVKLWDIRSPTAAAQSATLAERVYCMDLKYPFTVVGQAAVHNPSTRKQERRISMFDFRGGLSRPYREMASPLRQQLRSISLFRTIDGFAVGSVEGRCAVRYIDPSLDVDNRRVQHDPSRKGPFAFKCHRVSGTQLYPVNSIDFHPAVHSIFATAGGDGSFSYWDKELKQRAKEFKSIPHVNTSLSCCRWNTNGEWFAYAASYDWSKGVEYHKRTGTTEAIFVHHCVPTDLRKSR